MVVVSWRGPSPTGPYNVVVLASWTAAEDYIQAHQLEKLPSYQMQKVSDFTIQYTADE